MLDINLYPSRISEWPNNNTKYIIHVVFPNLNYGQCNLKFEIDYLENKISTNVLMLSILDIDSGKTLSNNTWI